MSDTVGTTLTSQQVTDIIARAKSGGGNPALVGIQIFNSLGDNVVVSGDILRLALTTAGLSITGPLATLVNAIQSVSKAGDRVTTENDQDIEVTLNGNRMRFKQKVTFDVRGTAVAPALTNITGVSVHKVISWIDILGIQLEQKQGIWSVGVTTRLGTVNFNLYRATP